MKKTHIIKAPPLVQPIQKRELESTLPKQKATVPHVHKWNVFVNHMTEAPEGQRCACGAQEWF